MTFHARGDDYVVLTRVFQQLRRTLESSAQEMRPIGPGFLVRAPSLPLVWTLNQIRIIETVTFVEAVALANQYQVGLPYRHIVVEDGPRGRRLEEAFRAAGWRVEREVVMALAEPPDREVDTSAVTALSEEQMLALMRQWHVEEHPDISVDGLNQLAEWKRDEGRLWSERRFGIVDVQGSPMALTKLRSDGTMAWVEDVYTVSEARGRGYARMLVTHATKLARSADYDLTFIIDDDDDWPKDLYARVGFRAIGRTLTLHQDLSPVP
jgi:GNAT superfamily N-acetyltransferase